MCAEKKKRACDEEKLTRDWNILKSVASPTTEELALCTQ
jgi:hypothetical protein